jgi:hypothetical protein
VVVEKDEYPLTWARAIYMRSGSIPPVCPLLHRIEDQCDKSVAWSLNLQGARGKLRLNLHALDAHTVLKC